MKRIPVKWQRLQKGLYSGSRRGSVDTPWITFTVDEQLALQGGPWVVTVGERGEAPNRRIGKTSSLASAKMIAEHYATTGKVLEVKPAKKREEATSDQHRRMVAEAASAGAKGVTQGEALRRAKKAAGLASFAPAGSAGSRAAALQAYNNAKREYKRQLAAAKAETAKQTKATKKAVKRAAERARHGGIAERVTSARGEQMGLFQSPVIAAAPKTPATPRKPRAKPKPKRTETEKQKQTRAQEEATKRMRERSVAATKKEAAKVAKERATFYATEEKKLAVIEKLGEAVGRRGGTVDEADGAYRLKFKAFAKAGDHSALMRGWDRGHAEHKHEQRIPAIFAASNLPKRIPKGTLIIEHGYKDPKFKTLETIGPEARYVAVARPRSKERHHYAKRGEFGIAPKQAKGFRAIHEYIPGDFVVVTKDAATHKKGTRGEVISADRFYVDVGIPRARNPRYKTSFDRSEIRLVNGVTLPKKKSAPKKARPDAKLAAAAKLSRAKLWLSKKRFVRKGDRYIKGSVEAVIVECEVRLKAPGIGWIPIYPPRLATPFAKQLLKEAGKWPPRGVRRQRPTGAEQVSWSVSDDVGNMLGHIFKRKEERWRYQRLLKDPSRPLFLTRHEALAALTGGHWKRHPGGSV